MRIMFVLILSMTLSPQIHAKKNDKLESFYHIAEIADAIIDASPSNITRHVARGTWSDEKYSVLHLTGRHISSRGTENLKQGYYLRMPDVGDERGGLIDGRRIYFIKGNGQRANPVIRNGVIVVTDEGTVKMPNGDVIRGIDDRGMPIYLEHFNECDLSDAPEMSGAEHSGDGKLIRSYSRKELLETLNSFECPNGSQWWRGKDRPDDHIERPPMTVNDFTSAISQHLKQINKHAAVKLKGEVFPVNKTVNASSNLVGTELIDEKIVELMNQVEGFVYQIPDKLLMDIHDRQIRRKKPNTLPKSALERVQSIHRPSARK